MTSVNNPEKGFADNAAPLSRQATRVPQAVYYAVFARDALMRVKNPKIRFTRGRFFFVNI
jgi:hypothetical protein